MSDGRVLDKKIGREVSRNAPRVSVVIPAYNCTEFIRDTLESVFAQTFQDYEIILVNDGSTDTAALEEILEPFDDRIVYVRQPNRGTAAARNTAIAEARGEYLAFLDADDIWMPEYLESQMEEIAARNCDMLYSDAVLFGDLIVRSQSFMTLCPSHGTVTTESLISGECNVINSGTVVRHQKVRDAGLFDEKLPPIGMEDFDLWFRLAKGGARIEYQRRVLLKYRIHRASLSGNTEQRAARAVTVLEMLGRKYVLTESEKEKVEQRLMLAVAELEIERGKNYLIHEDFRHARENFRRGNEYYRKPKYALLVWLLMLAPHSLLKLFLKSPPIKSLLMFDVMFGDSKAAAGGNLAEAGGRTALMAEIENTQGDSLTVQSAWVFFAKIVGFGMSILLPLLTVRYLTQDQVGVYRQVFLVVANAVAILPLGFSMSAYYYLNREPERRSSAISNILLFNFAMGGLAFGTLYFYPQLLGTLFQNEAVTRLAPLVGLVIWLWIFSSFLEIVALANKETRLATFFIILAQFTKTLLMTGAVVFFSTVEAFIYAAIVQALLQTAVLLVYLNRRFPAFWRSFDLSFFRRQLVYALPFGLAALLLTSQTDIHNYFVSYKFSAAEFAVYSVGCFQLPLIAILYESISSVIIPRMSELQSQGKRREMLAVSVSAMEKLAFAYFPLFFFLFIVAEEFIVTLFTRDYAASVPIFRVNLILLPFFCLIVDPIGRAFPEVGRFLLKLRVFLFVFLIAALIFAIRHFDLLGIISIVVLTVLLEKAASVYKSLKMLDVRAGDFNLLKKVGKTALAAAGSGLVFYVFYLLTKDPLLEFCAAAARFLLSALQLQKASEFVSGASFLGVSLIVYVVIYLFISNRVGTIENEDKENLRGFWQKVSRRGTAKNGSAPPLTNQI